MNTKQDAAFRPSFVSQCGGKGDAGVCGLGELGGYITWGNKHTAHTARQIAKTFLNKLIQMVCCWVAERVGR